VDKKVTFPWLRGVNFRNILWLEFSGGTQASPNASLPHCIAEWDSCESNPTSLAQLLAKTLFSDHLESLLEWVTGLIFGTLQLDLREPPSPFNFSSTIIDHRHLLGIDGLNLLVDAFALGRGPTHYWSVAGMEQGLDQNGLWQ
jgi:hypothetical protein